MKKLVIALSLITIVSFALRVYETASIPNGLNRDEAALAYNGLLLSEVGTDEWQRSWPLNLESFGDYKLIGYPFLLSLLFKVLSAGDFVVRLPSIIAGALLPLGLYFLSRYLKFSKLTSLLVAILSALMPVFFFYSRVAFEANLALTLFVFGMVFLLKESSWWSTVISVLCFSAAIFTYNTPLLLLPFVLLILPLVKGIKNYKSWLLPFVFLTVITAGAFYNLNQTFSQKSAITIFSDPLVQIDEFPQYRDNYSGIAQTLIGNKYVFYLKKISSNTLLSFSPKFLVSSGGSHPWHTLPGWGNLNWFVLALFYLGILLTVVLSLTKVIKMKMGSKELLEKVTKPWTKSKRLRSLLLLYLLGIAILPSSVTVDAPHTTRSLFFFVTVILIAAQTIEWLYNNFQKFRTNRLLVSVVIVLINLGLFIPYLYSYFSAYENESKRLYQSGLADVILEAESANHQTPIAIVDPDGYQYIVVSWYQKITPAEFYTTVVRQQPDRIGFRYGEQLKNYHFVAHAEDRREAEKKYILWTDQGWKLKE